MTEQESALTMADVDKRFGRKKVLDACTFEVATGSITALVGVNGAGKSTLMNLAVGLMMPDHGSISVLGAEPSRGGISPGLAYLAQHKPLYPKFTVAELLRFGAHTNDHWDAKYALGLVERADVPLEAKAKNLSPGQRTRVALALALGRRPKLLLLDEPLADLDPVARRSVASSLLEDVAEYGTTVLLSSHIISELADVSDRLLLLGDGNARLSGPLDELVSAHYVLVGDGDPSDVVGAGRVVHTDKGLRRNTHLVEGCRPSAMPGWTVDDATLDDLVLGHLSGEAKVSA
ncbi:ABC transporter ATP-binding protein [Rhodococcus sp. OK302]|uniref:ABC transporter ATP-binding protein n=1 Tax=Rhodococcus sp. OK302 TaxID=1882769 RepID=UPI000B940966|nr:ABC transporter ATP-binding protein [Rhodococcus sp. OK302]OYD67057.1 ABC-2 type transport system ATP-binding protein [Rhodococcus sp. OK302]